MRFALFFGLMGIAVLAYPQNLTAQVHQHGAGRMHVVVEGDVVEVEFHLPGADIVGFEHEPQGDTEKQAVEHARAWLSDAANVVRLTPAAQCRPVKNEADTKSHDGHAKKPHDHAHDKKHGDKHHGHGKKDEGEHNEFHIELRWRCADTGSLQTIDALLFERFPSLQELDAQVLTPAGQTAQELTPAAPRLNLPK